MSLPAGRLPEVPEETKRVARKAFRKGHPWIQLRDEMPDLYDNEAFADLYPRSGQPAYAPWRLGLVSVLQFAEKLSDQQAADAVRSRLEWKYLLALPLDDDGFDASVLSEFRTRLLEHEAAKRLFELLLERCVDRGWLKSGTTQRTDATHVLSVAHNLTRLELVLMTLTHVLEILAQVAPEWVVSQCPAVWGERYGVRLNEWHLPTKEEARFALAQQAGIDGEALLRALWETPQPYEWLHKLPAVEAMRRIWVQQFCWHDGMLQWRKAIDGMPSCAQQIRSPYEVEARYSEKRGQGWLGYKVHITETCETDSVRLITQVTTTLATTPDLEALPAIQSDLYAHQLLPQRQLVDAAYIEARALVESQQLYGIELFGPPLTNTSWQARAGNGFATSDFHIDWVKQQATCPAGHTSASWKEKKQTNGQAMVQIKFSRTDCGACPLLEQCTQTKERRRSLTVLPQVEWEALQQARSRMQFPDNIAIYAARAGCEGTISQAVRRTGLRQARYVGLDKTHLQSLLTATALNLLRILNWLLGVPIARTRTSRFRQLLTSQPVMV
jgi:transposase